MTLFHLLDDGFFLTGCASAVLNLPSPPCVLPRHDLLRKEAPCPTLALEAKYCPDEPM